mmetsp:Transcript_10352/g.31163  ORF Transcript_10352/g.31163 Transcript_10352/m.31163 type:complete len:285 (-) Transcript_10352:984-1838(-)
MSRRHMVGCMRTWTTLVSTQTTATVCRRRLATSGPLATTSSPTCRLRPGLPHSPRVPRQAVRGTFSIPDPRRTETSSPTPTRSCTGKLHRLLWQGRLTSQSLRPPAHPGRLGRRCRRNWWRARGKGRRAMGTTTGRDCCWFLWGLLSTQSPATVPLRGLRLATPLGRRTMPACRLQANRLSDTCLTQRQRQRKVCQGTCIETRQPRLHQVRAGQMQTQQIRLPVLCELEGWRAVGQPLASGLLQLSTLQAMLQQLMWPLPATPMLAKPRMAQTSRLLRRWLWRH